MFQLLNRRNLIFLSLLILLIFWVNPVNSNEKRIFSFDTLANGLLEVSYDTDSDGKPDFFELRIVVLSFNTKLTEKKVKKIYKKYDIFYDKKISFVYVTEEPLYHGTNDKKTGRRKYTKLNR